MEVSRISRIEKLEAASGEAAPVAMIWFEPRDTGKSAIARHEALHGKIPENAASVIFVRWLESQDGG